MRVLHLSDVHIDPLLRDAPLAAWMPKRMLGGANHFLRRRRHFVRAVAKLQELDLFRREHDVDFVICTGDYTVLGTDAELSAARTAIEPLTRAPLGFATVPGNHDVYLRDSVGRFERYFGDLLHTDLPDHQVDGAWPTVQLVGEHVAVVAVSSARPNPQLWRSSGRIPEAQLAALQDVLALDALAERFVFVITHYAPRLEDGGPDRFSHGLINADEFLGVCGAMSRGAILHGHVHRCYRVRVPGLAPRLFGAGSTTQDHREGFWLFDVDARGGSATKGGYVDGAYRLVAEPLDL